ncbi:MAG: HAD-IA family hydrolase [Clostridiales bacterium]|nr:HAD-IA family hydrolase [Clostridiales bacterium]
MNKLHYKAVIFDMDGVIFDSEKKVIECWEDTAKQYNIPDIKETACKCLGINATVTKQIFREVYGQDFDYDYYKSIMRNLFYERYGNGRLPLKPGIRELLKYLKTLGIKIAVASSTRVEMVSKELTDAKLAEYFDVIIGGDMVERSKPEPDIFLKAVSELGAKPEECFVIEDSYNGIRATYNAGIKGIMVPDLIGPDEEMRNKSFIILDSLTEVKSYLDSVYIYPHMCRCCKRDIINNPFDICNYCGWEDDIVQNENEDFSGGANKLSLREYKKNFISQ